MIVSLIQHSVRGGEKEEEEEEEEEEVEEAEEEERRRRGGERVGVRGERRGEREEKIATFHRHAHTVLQVNDPMPPR
jgi:hypothetical protein